ncbi:MAG: hypothetical protein ACI9WU_004211 [Myxococcota bacterium]|jgi:hypothetical protein
MLRFSGLLTAAVLLLQTGSIGAANAQDATVSQTSESRLSGSVDLTFANSYYFRGVNVFDDVFNLQPSATLGYQPTDLVAASLNVWAAVPFAQRKVLKPVRDEIDVTLDVTLTPLDGLSVSAGFILYTVAAADPFFHTEEIYVAASYDLPAGFAVGAGIYGDVNEFEGIYFKVGPSWSIDLIENLRFSTELFYGGAKYAGADFASVELGATGGFSADIGGGVSSSLSAIYNRGLDAETDVYAVMFGTGVAF